MSKSIKAVIFGVIVGLAIRSLTDLTIFQWQAWVFMIIVNLAAVWYAND